MKIIVRPTGKGQFSAALEDGRVLVASSRTPFFSAARVLLREGVDPATKIAMIHATSGTESLRSTVGAAAELGVSESGPRGPTIRRLTGWEGDPDDGS